MNETLTPGLTGIDRVKDINAFIARTGGIAPTGIAQGEPTVLSSEEGRKNFQSDVQPKIDKAKQNLLLSLDGQKTQKEQAKAEGLPQDLIDDMREGETPERAVQRKKLETITQQQERLKADLDTNVLTQTAQASAMKSRLYAEWDNRKSELERANEGNLATWRQSFQRTGVSEYSPGLSSDLLTAKETEGKKKLDDLSVQYTTLIGNIDSALASGKASLAAEYSKELATLEDKSNTILSDLVKEASKISDQTKANDVVAGALLAGLTESSDIYAYAREQGLKITAEEVDKIVGVLNPSQKMAGLSADYQTYKAMLKEEELPKGTTYREYLSMIDMAKESPKSDKITWDEATDRGLPLSLVGQTEEDIVRSLGEDAPPEWFVEKLIKEQGNDDYAQTRWDEYRLALEGGSY